MIKQLTKKQAKALKKGILPADWWNYGINPIIGHRLTPKTNSKTPVSNSLPVPNQLKEK